MDELTTYFTDMPKAHRTALLVGGLAFFYVIETLAPYFTEKRKWWKQTGVKLFFTVTTLLINLIMAFMLLKSADWVTANDFGILHLISMPIWLEIIVGLMLLDLIGAWLIHYIEHHVTFMWKFHLIHHSDQHIDTFSATRHHPGESVFRFVFTILAVLISGAPIWMVFLYQSISLVMSQFNHSNISFPLWLDKILSAVIATPHMHRVHHHYRMPYSDMNYGNIFSIWDRIFQTYVRVDNRKLKYGVDTHMDIKSSESIVELLKIPFKPYRPHVEYDTKEEL